MVEAFESKIVFDTTQAVANMQNLSNTVNKYTRALTNNAAATKGFNTQQIAVDQSFKGGVQSIDGATKSTKKLENQTKKATEQANRLELSWRSVLRVFAIQVVGRAITSLTSELGQSVTRARDLQKALAEIQTISPELRGLDLSGVQEFTEAISTDLGIEQIEVAAGLYQSLSNQVGNASQTLLFLRDASEFSIATVTELSASVDLLSGTLNALDLDASQTQRIMDILFKTIELGRVRGEELAGTFGRILPIATQLGVTLEEVASALAATTIQGVKTDDALTRINRVMVGLVKPSTGLQRVLDDLGIASVNAGIQVNGFQGFLQLLLEQTDGTIEGTSELFNEIRELQGVLLLTANNGQGVVDTLKKIEEESRGAAKAAAELILDTPAQQLERSIQQFRNILVSDFGNQAIDVINQLIKSFGGVENAANTFFVAMKVGALILVPLIGAQLVGAIGAMTAALVTSTAAAVGLTITLSALSGLGIVAALALITAQVITLNKTFNETPDRIGEVKDAFNALEQASTEVRGVALQNQQDINQSLKESVTENIRSIGVQVIELQKLYNKDRDSAIAAQKQATNSLNNQVNQRVSIIDKAIKKIAQSEEDAIDKIEALGRKATQFDFDINQRKFNLNLQATSDDPRRQTQLLQKRISELIKAAQQADDPKQRDTFLRQAVQRATQLGNIEGKRRDAGLALNKINKINQQLIERQLNDESERLKLVRQLTPELNAQEATIKATIEERNRLTRRRDVGLEGKTLTEAQVSAIQSRIDTLSTKLESEFKDFAITFEPIAEEKDIQKLLQSFRSTITGEPVELRIAATEAVDRTISILRRIPDTIPINVKLQIEQLTGEQFDIRGAGPIQAATAKLDQQLRTGIDNFTTLTDAQLATSKASQELGISISGTGKAVSDLIQKQFVNLVPAFDNVDSGLSSNRLSLKEITDDAKEAAGGFKQFRTALQEAVNQNDIDKLRQIQGLIPELIRDFNELASPEQATAVSNLLGTVSSQVSELIKAQAALSAATQQKDKVRALAIEVGNLSQLVQDQGLGQNAKTNIKTIGDTAQQQVSKVDALRQSIERLNTAGPTITPSQGQADGGPIRFFNDGGQARGTDTVPAMLSPGEFVVNASSSRRFFSELVAINSGVSPIYRQEGGPTTNNSFTGDINVNMPQGSSADGRTVAKQLRRELRRNTSNLRKK